MGDSSDFFGGALRFVGAVLNVLFRASITERPSIISSAWTDDSLTTSLQLSPLRPEEMSAVAAPAQSMQQRMHDEIAALKQIDPDFSELQFLSQATAQYQAYLSADGAMNADALKAIGTPALVDAYRARVTTWNDAGLRRVVHDVKMLGSAIIKVSLDGTRQAIVVRFSASGVRYTQDIDTGTATQGSSQPDSFTEFGTFLRPAGTTTPKSAGAGGATHCPSCGAPTIGGAVACPFCGTQLTGTGGNWLLDKTSESAYT